MTTATSLIKKVYISSDQIFTDALAQHVLNEHKNNLPDLSQVQILIPNAQAVLQTRLSLSYCINESPEKNTPLALIGGFIGSLPEWLKQNITSPAYIKTQISQSTRQLLLLEALKQHPDLFSIENHWQICDSLLELFDELNLSQHQWLNESTPVWIQHLQQAYQTEQEISHLNQEATIVQTLWHAWQQQLDALQIADESSMLKQRLLTDIPERIKDSFFYIAGFEQLSPLEQAWLEQLSSIAKVQWIIQGEIPENNKHKTATENSLNKNLQLLKDIYTQQQSLYERTLHYQQTENNFLINNIKLYDAQSAEQETQAVDLKIRMSLLAGKNNIAVVTENRKLARRLRALLERADVNIQDTAGWALATTSAATVLERWLECIEQDFAYQPFLDLLKSPFFCDKEQHEEHLNLVYRFEQDVVLHENIANDLQRYRLAIKHRKERLNLNTGSTAEQLIILLDKIESAGKSLGKLFHDDSKTTPDIWIEKFISSIESLGIYQQLSNDIAGVRVQQELEKLRCAHSTAKPELNWQDFRVWLGGTLEREQFKPHNQVSAVKIMNMQQAQYCEFDTLIIAGANIQSLPGSASQLPFFNQSVRQILQLKNWHQQKEYQFYQFQQMLLSAEDILITWQAEQNGEWMQASPWVSTLQDFSYHAFNQSLHDERLDYLLCNTRPVTEQAGKLLENIHIVQQALPSIKNQLSPTEISASRHQRLIDCPYKFFASDILKLKPMEHITQELLKSEYGENVHLILHAFHQQCPDLPEPFKEIITTKNRAQALAHMERISIDVFEKNVEDSIQHRGWLERWMQTAEAYIDWHIKRQSDWQIYKLELQADQQLNQDIKLTGRLDRVDQRDNQYSIIDYKTGDTAKQRDIDMAENIQLTSYAALMEEVSNVIYLKLDKGEARQTGTIEDTALDKLKKDTLQRLQTVITEIKSLTPLPAWGDSQTCNYCDMEGLCRKQMWEVNKSSQS